MMWAVIYKTTKNNDKTINMRKIVLSLLALVYTTALPATDRQDATDIPPTVMVKTIKHSVESMKEAVDLILTSYGATGVAVASDFDDTLFAKETELQNGQRLRYLEKSSFSDLSLHNGFHPVFQDVCNELALNLVAETKSFKRIREHIMLQDPTVSLTATAAHYYAVEEELAGSGYLNIAIEGLISSGVVTCIVSAEGGTLNSAKLELAQSLGFNDKQFLRGYKKFDQVLQFLQNHYDTTPNPAPFHTLVLIDDTLEYIKAWQTHGTKTLSQAMSCICPHSTTGEVRVVAIHYDFINQHQEFIKQRMLQEFYALYSQDYRSSPSLQPFLVVEERGKKNENRKKEKCIVS